MSDLCNPELLDKAATGRATSSETAELEAHAVACVTCARELSWLGKERALFSDRLQRRAPERSAEALWSHVEARMQAPVVQTRRPASWVGGALAAAAAILLMVKVVPLAMHHAPPENVVVIAAQGAGLPVMARHENVTKSWTMPLANDGRLVVSSVAGTVEVESAERADVLIEADHWPELDSSGWKVVVETKGKELSVRVECVHTCKSQPDVDLRVRIPKASHARVVIDTVSADIELDRVSAPVTAHAVSGEVHADRSNLVDVATTSGDIDVEHGESTALKLSSVSGDVSWDGLCSKGCDLRMTTVSGDVDLTPDRGSTFNATVQAGQVQRTRKQAGAQGEVRVITVSGEVDVPDVIHSDGDEDDGETE